MPARPIRRRRRARWPRSGRSPVGCDAVASAAPRRSSQCRLSLELSGCRDRRRRSRRPRQPRQAAPAPADPIFRSLFQAGDRAQPVSPAIHELWGNSSSLTSVAPATSVASATRRVSQPASTQAPAASAAQRSICSAIAAARSAANAAAGPGARPRPAPHP